MQPSQPASAPRAGGQAKFPPVRVNQVHHGNTDHQWDDFDHEEEPAENPEEYQDEDCGPEDPGVYSENEY